MEDFPLLLLFFIIYLIAGSSGKKRSKKRKGSMQSARRAEPVLSRPSGENHDTYTQEKNRMVREGFRTAFSEAAVQANRSCDQSSLHLHDVTNEQMLAAAEGEDPCHAGGIQRQSDSEDEYLIGDEAQQSLREDVLRGVIMSEILMRPSERRTLQRSRQRTNGY